jgi:hypothetical protein
MGAVEMLEEQIIRFHNWKLNPIYDENCFDEIELDKAIKQAKKMQKQEHGKTWDAALSKYEIRASNYMRAYEDFDDYYDEQLKQP